MTSITNDDQLFGSWGDDDSLTAGWYDLRSDRKMELPPIEGKPVNFGMRSSDSRSAIGRACEGPAYQPSNCVPWRWDGKDYHFLPTPLGNDFVPEGINAKGVIVGEARIAEPFDFSALLLEKNSINVIATYGVTNVVAHDINNRGDVITQAELDPQDYFKPVLYRDGKSRLLPEYPGAFITGYLGINERGDMVGFAGLSDGTPIALVFYRKTN